MEHSPVIDFLFITAAVASGILLAAGVKTLFLMVVLRVLL